MGIEHKHAYRFGYLKSEAWQTVRTSALARDRCRCRICGYESFFNDAHHVFYPTSVWATKTRHLVIVCRPCHELIHRIFGELSEDCKRSVEKFNEFADALGDWLKQHEALVTRHQVEKPDCRFCKKESDSVEYRNIHGHRDDLKESHHWPVCEPCWRALNAAFPAPRSWAQVREFKDKIHLLTNVR